MLCSILNKPVLTSFLLRHHIQPQGTWLHEICLRDLGREIDWPSKVFLSGFVDRRRNIFLEFCRLDLCAEVVWIPAVVASEVHEAVALGRRVYVDNGAVGRKKLVVCSEAVAGRVGVGEHACLEHWVGGGFDAGDHVGRREGGLFDVGEVVGWVAVEGDLADGAKWVLGFWPDLGHVEDVDRVGR